MSDLTETEVQALAKASNVTIPADLLTEVTNNLNGVLEALESIDLPGLDQVEPLPIIIPPVSPPKS